MCPLNAFNQAAGGKYKMRIIWDIAKGPRRYGELRRSAIVTAMGKPVTPRVLSRELKELEKRGLIARKQYPVIPPKVEYSLTSLGRTLVPVIKRIVEWGLAGDNAKRSTSEEVSGALMNCSGFGWSGGKESTIRALEGTISGSRLSAVTMRKRQFARARFESCCLAC
ncbi:MAG TPA: helix-turn-helix domain-containing protein [Blastocatellia bacterium]|nr:helix-turn-helix domain-containing protein [Blastocatellia bacterium]